MDLRFLRRRAVMLDAVCAGLYHSVAFLKVFFNFRGVAVFGHGC